jgi:hypothetical protein
MSEQALTPDVPPTEPGDLEDALFVEPPRWPKVVGIISIVWGALLLTCTGCGALAPAVFFPMLQSMVKAQGQSLPPTMQFGVAQWVGIALGGVMAVFLLIAGIMLVNRRPAARPLHLGYGVVAILQGIWGIAMQLQANQTMKVWVQQNPTSPFAKNNSPIGFIIGLAIGVVIAFAWPVFCLIWFGLVKRTHDSMTGGLDEPAA